MEPIAQIYKITNGFLLEINDIVHQRREVTYAETEKDIAEAIIVIATQMKLGVGAQGELFKASEMAPLDQVRKSK